MLLGISIVKVRPGYRDRLLEPAESRDIYTDARDSNVVCLLRTAKAASVSNVPAWPPRELADYIEDIETDTLRVRHGKPLAPGIRMRCAILRRRLLFWPNSLRNLANVSG